MKLIQNWTVHNMFAHPLSEVAYLLGFHELCGMIHDATIPDHKEGEGRG